MGQTHQLNCDILRGGGGMEDISFKGGRTHQFDCDTKFVTDRKTEKLPLMLLSDKVCLSE